MHHDKLAALNHVYRGTVTRQLIELRDKIKSDMAIGVDDPEKFVYALIEYSLYLVNIYSARHRHSLDSRTARELASNTTPFFLVEILGLFKEKVRASLREAGVEGVRAFLRDNPPADPEATLCMGRLLKDEFDIRCFCRTEQQVHQTFGKHQHVVDRFLVGYTLVKRLLDIIQSTWMDFGRLDPDRKDAFPRAVREGLRIEDKDHPLPDEMMRLLTPGWW